VLSPDELNGVMLQLLPVYGESFMQPFSRDIATAADIATKESQPKNNIV